MTNQEKLWSSENNIHESVYNIGEDTDDKILYPDTV